MIKILKNLNQQLDFFPPKFLFIQIRFFINSVKEEIPSLLGENPIWLYVYIKLCGILSEVYSFHNEVVQKVEF